jgi:hypothetical protein
MSTGQIAVRAVGLIFRAQGKWGQTLRTCSTQSAE